MSENSTLAFGNIDLRLYVYLKFQIIIPHRCSWDEVSSAKVCADLGQVQFIDDFELNNEDCIRKAVKYSDVVVNLIGRDWDTRNWPMEKVHVDGARRIAKICREMGVKKLIHTSTINASPNPPVRLYFHYFLTKVI